jgi:hypothetical protein
VGRTSQNAGAFGHPAGFGLFAGMEDQQASGAEHVLLGSSSRTPALQDTHCTEIPGPNGKGQARKLWPWQSTLVQRSAKRDAEHLHWFCGLSVAIGLGEDGAAAAKGFGATAIAVHDVTDHSQTIRHCRRVWGAVDSQKKAPPRRRTRYSAIAPHVGDRLAAVTPWASSAAVACSGSTRRATWGARP